MHSTGYLNAFRDGVGQTDLSSIRVGLLTARIGQKGPILQRHWNTL